MAIEMVINEHSLQQTASDIYEAQKWMTQFVKTIRKAAKCGVNRSLRMKNDLIYTTLAKDYPLQQWLNEVKNDPMRMYLKSLLGSRRLPPWTDFPDLEDQVNEYEFTHIGPQHNGPDVCGLWVSHRLEALAISLPSDSCWNSKALDLKIKWLEEDGTEKSETVEVIHASCPKHVCEHAKWINERDRSDIQDGNDLWNRRADLFNWLTFCEDVETKIRHLNPTMLRPVLNQLSNLETHCEEWTNGGFKKNGLLGKPRPESKATLEQFGEERSFLCPDGQMRTFSWHVSITQSWRLHFDPVENKKWEKNGKMIIGYVGPHLRTVRNRN